MTRLNPSITHALAEAARNKPLAVTNAPSRATITITQENGTQQEIILDDYQIDMEREFSDDGLWETIKLSGHIHSITEILPKLPWNGTMQGLLEPCTAALGQTK